MATRESRGVVIVIILDSSVLGWVGEVAKRPQS
jgi:hypothetical protein